ncbi:hypothetical protein [Endozoicomonas elysicola]|uniref:Lipoprotein n=1 Tax=Endozoicomonas elysicola TaxID=305900 RepID=A0A081KDH5_9GAMM|nr:hypothetical protein [Endozoicomonas elysicola]KEI72201.1 hypothetical protein GV64_17020 [Endozoicomonas elysicola]
MRLLLATLAPSILIFILTACSESNNATSDRQVVVIKPLTTDDQSTNDQHFSFKINSEPGRFFNVLSTTDNNGYSNFQVEYDSITVYEDTDRHLSPVAICYEPSFQKPALLYTGVMEGVGVNFLNMVIPGESSGSTEAFPLDASDLPVSCVNGQYSDLLQIPENEPLELCTCDISRLVDSMRREQQLRQLLPEQIEISYTPQLISGNEKALTFEKALLPIQGDRLAFEELLTTLQLADSDLKIEWINKPSGSFVNIITLNRPLYHQASYSFISNAKGNWFLLQYMTDSSKGFNTIKHVEGSREGFIVDMCLKSCNWWGDYGEVKIDTLRQTLSLKAITDG